MNLCTDIPAVVAVVATGILPVFLDRSRRLIGREPSPSLLTYVIILTPRWIATGVLLMQCVCRGDWGAGHSDVVRYAAALVLHGIVGLISFFSIAVAPADLKAVPTWISRCLVALGFVIPLGFVGFATWFLGAAPGPESNGLGLGPMAGGVFLISAGFGASVLLWALVLDLREQARLSLHASSLQNNSATQTRKSPTTL